jgi:hypothetical protein
MSAAAPRKLLAKSRMAFSNQSVFQTAEGLDIESNEQYEIVERRVLFDDVLLVTIHREKGVPYLVVTGLFSLFFVGLALLILSINVDAWSAAAVFGIMGSPVLLAFLIRLFLGVDVITVFGRRSKAELRFALRKKRAREVYGTICAAVRSAHRRAGAERSSLA